MHIERKNLFQMNDDDRENNNQIERDLVWSSIDYNNIHENEIIQNHTDTNFLRFNRD